MNIEEIKERRNNFVITYQEANGEKIMVADWMMNDYDWLIAEVEDKLANQLRIGKEAARIAERFTATRCAEIANECEVKTEWCLLESAIANAIKKEFNL